MKNSSVSDIKLINNPLIIDSDEKGILAVYENIDPSLSNMERVFMVKSEKENVLRGEHAHKECIQYLVCIQGILEVTCLDSVNTKKYILDKPETGLLIPPGIWSRQIYKTSDTMLMVICNRKYDEDDYIRNFDNFKSYKNI